MTCLFWWMSHKTKNISFDDEIVRLRQFVFWPLWQSPDIIFRAFFGSIFLLFFFLLFCKPVKQLFFLLQSQNRKLRDRERQSSQNHSATQSFQLTCTLEFWEIPTPEIQHIYLRTMLMTFLFSFSWKGNLRKLMGFSCDADRLGGTLLWAG